MTQSFNDRSRPPPSAHRKELLQLFNALAYRHDKWQVFSDFNEAAAISVSNAVDLPRRDKREQRYMHLIRRYSKEELNRFPEMLARLVDALEDDPSDMLGGVFHDLELHNKYTGQFFSPNPICQMMAKMTLSDREEVEARIKERGFITASEPAVGAGAMVIALAMEMKDMGINYQQHLHVTAVDVDPKCVHMAYLQFALLHIPAVVVLGNSLTLEERDHWYTPAHIMGGWDWKLRRKAEAAQEIHTVPEPITVPPLPEPDPAVQPSQLTLF